MCADSRKDDPLELCHGIEDECLAVLRLKGVAVMERKERRRLKGACEREVEERSVDACGGAWSDVP